MGWLKTTQTCHLTVLEVRNPKLVLLGENQGIGRILVFLEALGENPFHHPCQRLAAVCIPWLPALFSSCLEALLPHISDGQSGPALLCTLVDYTEPI